MLDDPEVMLARAAMHETAWRRRREDGDDLDLDGSLGRAERWLRAALLARPAFEEARLRLGRVQTMGGDLRDALATLRGISRNTEAGYAYLGKLFEGDVLETLGERDAARAACEAAIGIIPAARSARTALAHLLHVEGNRHRAADIVGAMLVEIPSTAIEEPWLVYSTGTAWRSEEYLDMLRNAVVVK